MPSGISLYHFLKPKYVDYFFRTWRGVLPCSKAVRYLVKGLSFLMHQPYQLPGISGELQAGGNSTGVLF
jgi:hypothetical protein